MKMPDPFRELFIFEMANNHQGSVGHGREIIRQLKQVSQGFDFRFAVKLQYRNLDSFIHPAFRDRTDIKYVKRFRDTELKEQQLLELKEAISEAGFIAICTPFDEDSVGWIESHGFDCLKIASCSLTDWPLLERIAQSELPVIASTAGATLVDIDQVTSFFRHREKPFALMHCVGEYPTPRERLQMGQIQLLRERYPEVTIGYSTHESPDETEAIKMAVASGAQLFEKHVGVGELNAYSANPEQVRKWLQSAAEAFSMLGYSEQRVEVTSEEVATLNALRRAVFARADLPAGTLIDEENTFLAIPSAEGQLLANDLSKYSRYTTNTAIGTGEPVMLDALDGRDVRSQVLGFVQKVAALLRESRVSVPHGAPCELSHHYGLDRFEQTGATIISVINREYCKKLIVLLPGQDHPVHAHQQKEETFHVLFGELELELGGDHSVVGSGEMVTVERGVKHAFRSARGAVFEELSTTHYPNDSFYDNAEIHSNHARKTQLRFNSDWLTGDLG